MVNRLVALTVVACLALSTTPAVAAEDPAGDQLGDWLAGQVEAGEPAIIAIETAGRVPADTDLPLSCVHRAVSDATFIVDNPGWFLQNPVILVLYTAGIPVVVVTCALPVVDDVLSLISDLVWYKIYGRTLACAFSYADRVDYFESNIGYFLAQPELAAFWLLAIHDEAAFCLVAVATGVL